MFAVKIIPNNTVFGPFEGYNVNPMDLVITYESHFY